MKFRILILVYYILVFLNFLCIVKVFVLFLKNIEMKFLVILCGVYYCIFMVELNNYKCL